MKKFSRYLNFINEFDMWDQIFPGVSINKEVKDANNLAIYIANLFKDNDPSQLNRTLIAKFKIEGDIANKSIFLINLLSITPEKAFDLYKEKIRCHCTDQLISEWVKIGELKGDINKFINYQPTTSSQELMDKGLKGAQIGIETRKIETEKFRNL